MIPAVEELRRLHHRCVQHAASAERARSNSHLTKQARLLALAKAESRFIAALDRLVGRTEQPAAAPLGEQPDPKPALPVAIFSRRGLALLRGKGGGT